MTASGSKLLTSFLCAAIVALALIIGAGMVKEGLGEVAAAITCFRDASEECLSRKP